MSYALGKGEGTLAVQLFAIIPWLLMVLVPLVATVALPIYLYFQNKHKRRKVLKVLVVDDDESSILSLVSILSDKATEICIADNGENMIKELQDRQYDLVFVDRVMPILPGEAALAAVDDKIKSDHLGELTPVVFFTNNTRGLSVPKLNHFEVVEVWGKQINFQNLQNKVNGILNRIRDVA